MFFKSLDITNHAMHRARQRLGDRRIKAKDIKAMVEEARKIPSTGRRGKHPNYRGKVHPVHLLPIVYCRLEPLDFVLRRDSEGSFTLITVTFSKRQTLEEAE